MNIYDIAQQAGVSIETVSRVLNNKGNVSEKTQKKIQDVLDRNDYQPSAIARGLVAGSMKTVAILTVDVRVPHYAMTSYVMEEMMSKLGYMVLLCNTGERPENWKKYLTQLAERHVDGIVLTGSIYERLTIDDIPKNIQNIPIVMANGRLDMPGFYSVLVDEGRGMALAAEHLHNRGKQKIAFVRDLDTESADRKRKGFLDEMKILGVEHPEKDIFHTEYGMEGGRKAAAEIAGKGYDGIVFGEDLTAVGAVHELVNRGISVPEQIAVTGCNNSEYATVCNPMLTSVDNKGKVLSELTVKLLIDLLTGNEEKASIMVIPELVVRETS